jgi:hypothetical protein
VERILKKQDSFDCRIKDTLKIKRQEKRREKKGKEEKRREKKRKESVLYTPVRARESFFT